MAIKTYKKTDTTKLSENFRVSEFACHGKGCCSTVKIDEKLVKYLQQIRDHFGKAVTITSGYRCEKHNANTKNSAKTSRHTKGQAADIKVKDTAPADVAKYAESIGILGIGLYETDKDGYFVHIDTRTSKAFWYGQAQEKRTTFGGSAAKEATVKIELAQLQDGAKGEQVKTVQRILIALGYDLGKYGADGDFGNATEKAVKAFQTAKKIGNDGIVGENTWNKLLKG